MSAYIVEWNYRHRPFKKWGASTKGYAYSNIRAATEHWNHYLNVSGSTMAFRIRKTRKNGLMVLDYWTPAGPEAKS